jgi:hypothetical protein
LFGGKMGITQSRQRLRLLRSNLDRLNSRGNGELGSSRTDDAGQRNEGLAELFFEYPG